MIGQSWERAFASQNRRIAWGWIVAAGCGLLLLGVIALSTAVLTTIVSVVLFGILLIGAGIIEIALAIASGGGRSLLLWGVIGVLCILAGAWLLARPISGALALTIAIGIYLIVSGGIQLVGAIADRADEWVWQALLALVLVLLGILLLARWPVSGFYAIGLFLGINFLVDGAILVGSGLALRTPRPRASKRAAA